MQPYLQPHETLTRSGHIFNLWLQSHPWGVCKKKEQWRLCKGGERARERHSKKERESECLCQTLSNVNSLDAVCHHSAETQLSCSHCPIYSCYETAFRGWGYGSIPYTEAAPNSFIVLWGEWGSLLHLTLFIWRNKLCTSVLRFARGQRICWLTGHVLISQVWCP